ncbi:peptide ligase PGM1-related protein [Streptomyces sp. ME19-01-6]|uniref:preATP grasp domain-containing protein n=1 Tax=Streptomyces sp. ME19-01-6 TaxID=3028686 RepID=UPI0029AA1B82|nr:peptide ligase PGM1-related protein [Streptomyces sp. ME19-01-6]MDX3228653.1 peptide ligase PGM1-related protein [Streptomyces sp. ME19-01-6]
MVAVLIGNSTNADLVGSSERDGAGWWAQRLLWFARDTDIVVLPVPPQDEFLDYVTSLTGTRRDRLRVVVPPPGAEGSYRLTRDRLVNPEFHEALRQAVDGREITSVFPLWPDAAVAEMARSLGAETAVPGHRFLSQGGGALVNSKVVFRAVAAGSGVPLPEGTVCGNRQDAEDTIWEMLERGHPVIAKHEYASGGAGNQILSPFPGVRALGAPQVTLATDRSAVDDFLAKHWDPLTDGGRYHLVVERYFPESTAVFAEFLITDRGPELGAHGEMIMAPVANAQVIPAPGLTAEQLTVLVEEGRRLCLPLHAMGYRGRLSADAVVTPDGAVLFTEYNGRVTGSTHMYRVLGEHVVGQDYPRRRVVMERVGWQVPSFDAAAERLTAAGIAYDRETRTGVLLNTAFSGGDVWYCVVAEDVEAARRYEDVVSTLFPEA